MIRFRIIVSTSVAAIAIAVCAPVSASDIFNGKEVYELHCEGCHGSDGSSFEPGVPDFSRGESLFAPDSELVERLREGSAMKPSFRGLLTDAELRDVIAYVRTLQR
jgi:mono/diheme cytochrome c family protein